MADIVVLQPRRRSRRSSTGGPVLIAEAPPLADELAANQIRFPRWVCLLVIIASALVAQGMFWASIGFLLARLP